MIRIAHNLDAVIALLEAVRTRGLTESMQRALAFPQWRDQAVAVAQTTLMALATPAEQGYVAGFVAGVVHLVEQGSMTLQLTAPVGLVSGARALMEQAHTRDYRGTPRLRQRPLETSDQEDAMLSRLREIVRQWVIQEKDQRPEDEDVDYDPDDITDRVMRIMGITGGRDNWRGILSPLDREGQTDMGGHPLRVPGSGIQREVGEGLADQIERWLSQRPELTQHDEFKGYSALPLSRTRDWLAAVAAAWSVMVIDRFPQVFQVQFRTWYAEHRRILLRGRGGAVKV